MTSKPAGGLVFFIDRSLGRKQVAEAFREVGGTVEVHDNHFPQTTPDVDWLAEVGRRGWVVLSKDDRIRPATASSARRWKPRTSVPSS
ncbi:MAG: hypothetical protein R3E35_05245 [Rhodocyclaceae bacterium]